MTESMLFTLFVARFVFPAQARQALAEGLGIAEIEKLRIAFVGTA
jgi:hypothetical protein